MPEKIDVFFRPHAVALVGASRKRGTVGAEILHNLLMCGFPGPVYPVNPSSPVVQSIRTYPSVSAIPDEVDLAVIVVPAQHVETVVDDCIAKRVKGIVIISAGFAETGEAGAAAQERILQKVRDNGIRMVGPNCLGVLSTDPEWPLNATFAPTAPEPGAVAFSSQSGALGVAILDYAQDLGIGIRQFVSMGNKADVSGNDLIESWEDDPGTSVILLYIESFGNPRRFMQIARRVTRRKPIVLVKSGRTEAGARAASSHTGSLAGLDVAVDALLWQAGVIRTETIEELFDVAMLLANQPVPRGDRVAILTNAGGPGIMASDACASRGLEIPKLSDETEAALRELLPAEASVRNPVDMLASAGPEQYERATRLMLADDQVDALIVLFVPPIVTETTAVADAIQLGAEGTDKPVLTSFLGTHGVPEALSSLREGNFPSYAFPEAAALALVRAVQYGRWLQLEPGTIPELDRIDDVGARAAVAPAVNTGAATWLAPEAVYDLLAAYGIAAPVLRVTRSAEAAADAAEEIGFPVALKLWSTALVHKTEVGGVTLALKRPEDVWAAYRRMEDGLRKAGMLEAMDGAVVQKMADRGVETFIGMTLDPKFGPLIAFGIGGVSVELWRDVVFRVHPLTDLDARQMLDQIRGVKLLDGFRGSPPADRAALIDALLRISRMVGDLPEILELDLNPLIALEPGRGAIAVDARIRVGGNSTRKA